MKSFSAPPADAGGTRHSGRKILGRSASILRDAAHDRPCQVRLPGVCNGRPATSVLAHYRLAGINGVGMKPPDTCAAIACSACHDVIDGRVRSDFEREFVRLAHAEGVMRTLAIWDKEGLL